MKKILPWLLCGFLGCNSNPGLNPDPVPLTGTVSRAGAPLDGVVLNFLPAGPGAQQVGVELKDGKFDMPVNPGEYLIIFTEGKDEAASKKVLETLPEAYLVPSEETKITVTADTPLELDISG